MNEDSQLIRLAEWLQETGRTKAWMARTLGYSYQTVWGKLNGHSALTDEFVVRCFSRIAELPPDIFETHGYILEDGMVCKRMPLEADS